MASIPQAPWIDRFWQKVRKSEDGGCWEWQGARNSHGYGSFGINKRSQGAHRVMYELERGPIPPGMYVLHRCDNRNCVNPAHLYLGTHLANIHDMVAKQRHQYGEAHFRHKLTERIVRDMRRRYYSGQATQVQLAAEYGIHNRTAQRAIIGKTWRHVGL
jgi:hypothetical protein